MSKKTLLTVLFLATTITPVFAQVDPTDEINSIIDKVTTIITRVGSGVFLIFIAKDAFEILQNKDNPHLRKQILVNMGLLIVAALFLFRPQLILDAIKFIANITDQDV